MIKVPLFFHLNLVFRRKRNVTNHYIEDRRHKIFNPGWNGVDKFDEWDLALLELYEPITVRGDSKARAACLPHPNDKNFAAGTNFVLSGWHAFLVRHICLTYNMDTAVFAGSDRLVL